MSPVLRVLLAILLGILTYWICIQFLPQLLAFLFAATIAVLVYVHGL